MEESERCCSRLVLNLKMGKIEKFFGEPLKHVMTIRGRILVSRIGDDPPPPPCTRSKRFPCLRSKRFRVYWHQAHMFPTCGLGAGTHGDVLNLHTESVLNVCTVFFHVFSPCRNTPNTHHDHQQHHDHNDTTTTTTHTNTQQHTTTHGDRERETRQDETRQEGKRREEKR